MKTLERLVLVVIGILGGADATLIIIALPMLMNQTRAAMGYVTTASIIAVVGLAAAIILGVVKRTRPL